MEKHGKLGEVFNVALETTKIILNKKWCETYEFTPCNCPENVSCADCGCEDEDMIEYLNEIDPISEAENNFLNQLMNKMSCKFRRNPKGGIEAYGRKGYDFRTTLGIFDR
ncbi:MAG: hypothetical protein ACTSSP_10410 [Candidatus Asgardarchaeia archaeon]